MPLPKNSASTRGTRRAGGFRVRGETRQDLRYHPRESSTGAFHPHTPRHVPLQLGKTLASTDVIESAFSIVEQVCKKCEALARWRPTGALGWVWAAGCREPAKYPASTGSIRNPGRGTGGHKRPEAEQPRLEREPQEHRCQLRIATLGVANSALPASNAIPSIWFSFSFLLSLPAAKNAIIEAVLLSCWPLPTVVVVLGRALPSLNHSRPEMGCGMLSWLSASIESV
jgi:hypothetical protein